MSVGESVSSFSFYVMSIFYILVSILWSTCVIANLIVIMTFFRTKSLRGNYSYWYTAALAISDLLLGSTGIPLQVLTTEQILPISNLTCDILIAYETFLGAMEMSLLMGMAIDRYITVSSLRITVDSGFVMKYFIFITMASISSIFFMIIPHHEYDFTKSNCFILQRNTKLSDWAIFALTLFIFAEFTIMSYFNIRVFVILHKFNALLNDRAQKHPDETERNNNGLLMELSYHGGEASITKITTSPPTIHDVRRGKTIKGWIRESRKQRQLLTMSTALEFTSFFTLLSAGVMYVAMNYTSCEICRESVFLRSISPWSFLINQALDPLILFVTNRSFRRGAKLLLSRCLLSRRYT